MHASREGRVKGVACGERAELMAAAEEEEEEEVIAGVWRRNHRW